MTDGGDAAAAIDDEHVGSAATPTDAGTARSDVPTTVESRCSDIDDERVASAATPIGDRPPLHNARYTHVYTSSLHVPF